MADQVPANGASGVRPLLAGWRHWLSETWVSTAVTAVGFIVLSRLHLLGSLPLVVPVVVLVASAVISELAGRRWGPHPSAGQLDTLVALHVLNVALIIYMIGWGATLAVGYLFVVARDLEDFGSRATRPAVISTVLATALGQAAVQAGLVHSYVHAPAAHGLAALESLGVVFVVHLLGSKTSERERDQAALARGEASFRQLFADNPQPMWVFDAETLQFIEVNDAAVGHYGYTRDEFLARTIADIRPSEDLARLHVSLQNERRGVRQGCWRHRVADGRLIDVEVSSHPLVFGGREAVLVAVQDVTQRAALEEELRHQAFHDSLTNLANRALFLDRADHAIRRLGRGGPGVAVLMLDLDGFKTVNDSLGHAAGDALLVAVAARVQGALRTTDTAARLGGDEFAILVEDAADGDEAMGLAQRVLEALDRPFEVSGKQLFARASVGAAWTDGDHDADSLLRDADAAMYEAKAHGKGSARLFEPGMYTASLARLELETDLRGAVERGEFVLHYQPVISMDSTTVVAFEALVRWQHPRRGLIEPDSFIPAAEENGLIVDIGRWVLTEACRQARAWQLVGERNGALSIAVNVSARQLADPGLVHDVERALQSAGLAPGCLTLEITESVLIADPEAAVAKLRQLKAVGVRLAIDDFGTGYSSLSSLQSLPVDALKIDKAFVDGVGGGAEAAALVEAIVRLAANLALETVAEGVERPEQLESLLALGCQQIQGFYFSEPLPPAGAEQLLRSRDDDVDWGAGALPPAVTGLR